MFNSSPSLADIAAVTGGNRNDGAWGDGGWWVLIILFALFGGWGGYGFGGNGGGVALVAAGFGIHFDKIRVVILALTRQNGPIIEVLRSRFQVPFPNPTGLVTNGLESFGKHVLPGIET